MPVSSTVALQDRPVVIEAAICPYRAMAPVWDVHGMINESKACIAAGAAIIHHHHDMRFDSAASIDEMLTMGRAVKAAHPQAMPHARQVAQLGQVYFGQGRGLPAQEAQPLYLRNKVALTTAERELRDAAKGAA